MEARRKPIPILVLQRPSENELIQAQRRKAERVDTLVPLFYETKGGRGLEASGNTLARNLSSTGLSFNTREPISSGSRLQMEIQLPNVTGGMSAWGTIVACSKIAHPTKERYKIRVHFDQIANINQQRIDEFVKQKKGSQDFFD
jgi:c-di-GMP-binding flagellar brake protein YcgR